MAAMVMIVHLLLLPLLLLSTQSSTADAQDPRLALIGDTPPEKIFLGNSTVLAIFLYPPATIVAETPYVVRLVLVQMAAAYNAIAPCHPTARSFFGTRDHIAKHLCHTDMITERIAIMLYFAMLREYPNEAASLLPLLKHFRYNVTTHTHNPTTNAGWAWRHTRRLHKFFTSDGWNSEGLQNTAPFRHPFADTTNYNPVNPPTLPTTTLRRPLRWQPLHVDLDGRGRFAHQVHTVPHIGLTVQPLALSKANFAGRTTRAPYFRPNTYRTISGRDRHRATGYLKAFLRTARRVTPQQRALAAWWDGKLASVGAYSAVYHSTQNFSRFDSFALYLSAMIAQHDAMLLAWKEKRRHDLVRPQTLVRNMRHGEMGSVFVTEVGGVARVNLSHFESVIPAQPHSEFPSASAVQCTAASESTASFVRRQVTKMHASAGSNSSMPGPFPPFKFTVERNAFNERGPDIKVEVEFKSGREMARSCGLSRLWAGVHFRPAVEAGWKLGEGVGVQAFEHVTALMEGRLPKNCLRCGKY